MAPVSIAALMIAGGTLVSQFDQPGQPIWPGRLAWGFNFGGIALALYVFMADAIRVAGGGERMVRAVLPVGFNWLLFLVALALLAAPVVDVSLQLWRRRSRQRLTQAT